jgi:hypothetical protein
MAGAKDAALGQESEAADLKEAGHYVVTAQEPGAVVQSVKCSFLAPGSVVSIHLACTVLYCIVLYCIVLYCIVLYCIVLYCIVLYYCLIFFCICIYIVFEFEFEFVFHVSSFYIRIEQYI